MNAEEQVNENAIDISALKENVKTLGSNRDHDKRNAKINSDFCASEFERISERITELDFRIKMVEPELKELNESLKSTIGRIDKELKDLKEHRKFWNTIRQLGYLKWVVGIVVGTFIFFYGLHVEQNENKIAVAVSGLQQQLTIIGDRPHV